MITDFLVFLLLFAMAICMYLGVREDVSDIYNELKEKRDSEKGNSANSEKDFVEGIDGKKDFVTVTDLNDGYSDMFLFMLGYGMINDISSGNVFDDVNPVKAMGADVVSEEAIPDELIMEVADVDDDIYDAVCDEAEDEFGDECYDEIDDDEFEVENDSDVDEVDLETLEVLEELGVDPSDEDAVMELVLNDELDEEIAESLGFDDVNYFDSYFDVGGFDFDDGDDFEDF